MRLTVASGGVGDFAGLFAVGRDGGWGLRSLAGIWGGLWFSCGMVHCGGVSVSVEFSRYFLIIIVYFFFFLGGGSSN